MKQSNIILEINEIYAKDGLLQLIVYTKNIAESIALKQPQKEKTKYFIGLRDAKNCVDFIKAIKSDKTIKTKSAGKLWLEYMKTNHQIIYSKLRSAVTTVKIPINTY